MKTLIISALLVLTVLVGSVSANWYRDINTTVQSTDVSEYIHVVEQAVVVNYLKDRLDSKVLAVAIPWSLGLVKELTDVNFGWDDLAGNTVGCIIGLHYEHIILTPRFIIFHWSF